MNYQVILSYLSRNGSWQVEGFRSIGGEPLGKLEFNSIVQLADALFWHDRVKAKAHSVVDGVPYLKGEDGIFYVVSKGGKVCTESELNSELEKVESNRGFSPFDFDDWDGTGGVYVGS